MTDFKNQNKIVRQEQQDKVERKSRRGLVLLLLLTLVVFTGTVFAYFSDVISDNRDLESAELKINGAYSFTLNGVDVPSGQIEKLLPGDIIVIEVQVSNIGNQEAWVREKLTFTTDDLTFIDNFVVVKNVLTRSDFESSNYNPEDLLTFVDGVAVSTEKVLGHASIDNELADYPGGSYTVSYTVYFNIAAGNDAQNKAFNIKIETQALQYANNNEQAPSEAAWDTVAAALVR